MKTKILLFVLSCLLIQQSCYEDKGNYDYITPNIVTPKGGSLRNFQNPAYLGELYTYYPKLDFSNPNDTTNFEFWWEFTGTLGDGGYDTLCIGRELRFTPNIANYINMRMCALDKITGVISSFFMQVRCVSAVAKGWTILSDLNGKSSISLIRPEYIEEAGPDGEKIKTRVYTPFVNIYTKLQTESLGTGPLQIRQLLNMDGNIILVMQESGDDYLNGGSYAKEMTLAKEFPGGLPANFQIKDFFFGTSTDVVLNANGEVFTRTTRDQAEYQSFYRTAFANIPTEYQGEKLNVTSLIPTLPSATKFFGLYDKNNNRILWMVLDRVNAAKIAPTVMPEDSEKTDFIDPGNIKDWELLYCGSHTSFNNSGITGSSYFICLFKKGDAVIAEHFCGTTNWPDFENVQISELESVPFSGKKYITDKTKYYMLATRSYLFFAEKNVIYWYDLNSKVTKDFYHFPEGSVIVDMSSNPQESELGVILENGVFATLNIANEKLYDGLKIWGIDGLGKCVDLEYRYVDYNQFVGRQSSYAWD